MAELSGQGGDGVVVITADDAQADIDPPMLVAAAIGSFFPALGRPYGDGLPDAVAMRIALALADQSGLTGERDFVRTIRTPDDRRAAVYFRAASAFDPDQLALVDIMCALVASGWTTRICMAAAAPPGSPRSRGRRAHAGACQHQRRLVANAKPDQRRASCCPHAAAIDPAHPPFRPMTVTRGTRSCARRA